MANTKKKKRRVKRQRMPEQQSVGSAIMQFIRCAIVWRPPGRRVESFGVSAGARAALRDAMAQMQRIVIGDERSITLDGVAVKTVSRSKKVYVAPVYRKGRDAT